MNSFLQPSVRVIRTSPLIRARNFMIRGSIFDTGLTPITNTPLIDPLVSSTWTTTTDNDIRGSSTSKFEDLEGGGLKWTGFTSLDLDQRSIAVKTGFVSVTSPSLGRMFQPYLDLDDYESIELTIRKKDTRNYIVNLHPDSYIEGEIYQGFIMDDREDDEVRAGGVGGAGGAKGRLLISKFLRTRFDRPITNNFSLVASLLTTLTAARSSPLSSPLAAWQVFPRPRDHRKAAVLQVHVDPLGTCFDSPALHGWHR